MRRSYLALLACTLLACGSSSGESAGVAVGEDAGPASPAPAQTPGRVAQPSSAPAPGTAWVVFGADTVVAEVARTSAERSVGLSNRDEVPDGTGMLFVFESSAVRQFWMQDTFVALDIAFIDEELRIVDIQQMEPESEEIHTSAAPAMFALEVRQGWFAEHGVEVGDQPNVMFGG